MPRTPEIDSLIEIDFHGEHEVHGLRAIGRVIDTHHTSVLLETSNDLYAINLASPNVAEWRTI